MDFLLFLLMIFFVNDFEGMPRRPVRRGSSLTKGGRSSDASQASTLQTKIGVARSHG